MESYIGAAPKSLISQLDFSVQSTAPYVLQRRSVRMYPSSASTFSSNTVNVARITLASEGEWLDPSTLRFCCTIVNNDANRDIYPFSCSAASLFQRVREEVGGSLISDVLNYARTAEMFQNKLEPAEWQFSEGVLGFAGSQFGMADLNYERAAFGPFPAVTDAAGLKFCPASRHPVPGRILPNSSYTCLQRILTGLVKSNKLIPLRVCPVTYSFHLEIPANFCDPGYSQNYTLQNCYILCDLITLDSSIQNTYMKQLLSGSALSVVIPSYITVQYQVANAASMAVIVQRALTRCVAVFVSFSTAASNVTQFVYPDENLTAATNQHFDSPFLLDSNFSFQLQLGSKLWPEQPMSSLTEMYETLRKAVGTHNQDIKSISLDRVDYVNNSFILGVDLEKNLGDPFSSQNTRAGDVLSLRFNGINNPAINSVYVTLIGSSVVEIRETGAFVFD